VDFSFQSGKTGSATVSIATKAPIIEPAYLADNHGTKPILAPTRASQQLVNKSVDK